MRAVVYARYSSDNQRDASIDDQVRVCRDLVDSREWIYLHTYTDRAISGASPIRPGYQKLLHDARAGEFDVVVAEALDRLSRDLSDVALLYKHLSFLGVRLVTLAEGEIGDLHVGLKGTMNALYLKDLAQKTWRGLEGRVRLGKSGGGLCYGYNVVREINANGEPLRGGRSINPTEAAVVRRIFQDYATGVSPRAIAVRLNRESIAGPRGLAWGASSIRGNPKRGTGILNNELYIGRLVWNRLRYIKDPETGKRISRPNPESAWIIQSAQDLRIVEDDLWEAVHRRQAAVRKDTSGGNRPRPWNGRRHRHALSGLIRCGSCRGSMVLVGGVRYGCATARNKGLCDNRHTIRREILEESVFAGLKSHLMRSELVKEFITEFHAEVNRLTREATANLEVRRRELARVERQIRSIVDAIKDGICTPTMKDELLALEARKVEIGHELSGARPPQPLIHPNVAEIYQRKVERLHEALDDESTRAEAAEALRQLIEQIRLTPDRNGRLEIELHGELAGILALTNEKAGAQKPPAESIKLVAGAGNHRQLTLPAIAV